MSHEDVELGPEGEQLKQPLSPGSAWTSDLEVAARSALLFSVAQRSRAVGWIAGLGAIAAMPFHVPWVPVLMVLSTIGFLVSGVPVSIYARYGTAVTTLLAAATWAIGAIVTRDASIMVPAAFITLLAIAVPMRDWPRAAFAALATVGTLAVHLFGDGAPMMNAAITVAAAAVGWFIGYQLDFQLRDALIHWSREQGAATLAREREKRAKEAEIQAARLVDQERWATLGRVAIGVGHEIKNPLQAVLSSLQYARETGSVEGLDDAFVAAERIRSVVDDLGHFRGRPSETENQRENLLPALEAIVRQARIGLTQTHVEFGTLPPVSISYNAARLVQVMANLLTNAWHAGERSGAVRVRIHGRMLERAPERVEVYVDDDGPGIPSSAFDRIFEVFVTTKPSGKGTGLGLPISRAIVQSFGGTLEARSGSSLGGARLVITLPAHPPIAPPIPAPEGGTPAPAPRSSLPNIHRRAARATTAEHDTNARAGLLIIEDNPIVRRVIARSLSDTWEVHQAEGTREARTLLRKAVIDVVLCDLHLQQEDALDVLELIGGVDRRLLDRVVFMSGQATSSRLVALVNANPERQLEKPFDRQRGEALLNAAKSDALPALELPTDYSSADNVAVMEPAWTYESPTEEIPMVRTAAPIVPTASRPSGEATKPGPKPLTPGGV